MFSSIWRDKFDIPEKLDPYSVLNITSSSSHGECKSSFRNLVTNPSRSIREKACLAYYIICNKNNYIKEGNEYEIKKRLFLLCISR